MAHWKPGHRYYSEYWTEDQVPSQLQPDAWKQYEVRYVGWKG